MKRAILFLSFAFIAALIVAFTYPSEKLIEPAKLVDIIKNPSAKKPRIFNVGPTPMIPSAERIDNVAEPANKTRFTNILKNIPKDQEIVIYCGCCKLEDCYNIFEADKILKSMGFTNYKILNMPTDFTTDWVSKNYPVQ